MDLQQLADSFTPMTCIISVDSYPDGSYGNIRLVCGNKAYVDSIEVQQSDNIAYDTMLSNRFIPNSPYENYIPKDLNFENACYLSAVLKKPFHTYMHPERYPFWVDMYIMPVAYTNGITHYCTYSMDLTPEASVSKMSDKEAAVTSSVLETCIKLRDTKDFKHTMDEVIEDIRLLCDAENVCILLTDYKTRSCSVLCESTSPTFDNKNIIDYFNTNIDNFFDVVDKWKDTIAGSTCLIIQNESDMNVVRERNPEWIASLEEYGIKSIVLYPLNYNNETLGYVWAVNFATENTAKIRSTLETTTYFIASEIANHQLLARLEYMSSVDLLTGVMNRNAMNKRVDDIVSGKETLPLRVGVIFADLNGLKKVNDTGGHTAGDNYIKRSAVLLKEAFPDSEIYRAGGDEFMVINYTLSKDELLSRIDELRKLQVNADDVSFALGYSYNEGKTDIRTAMSSADMDMYRDKQSYYERYPERRRK
jgi:diguanylate cyclase (GGDEF)-like protein